MKAKITNNRKGSYGVEKVGGGFQFIAPGKTRVLDIADPSGLDRATDIEFEAIADVDEPPSSLKAKAEKVGAASAKKTTTRRTSTRRKKGGA